MYRFIFNSEKKTGLPPGSPVYVGDEKNSRTKISVIAYDREKYLEYEDIDWDTWSSSNNSFAVMWIQIVGIRQIDLIEKICRRYNIHALVSEDILNTLHRPKIEYHEEYVFLILKALEYNRNNESIDIEQVSLILGENVVISFVESQNSQFESIKDRILKNYGKIRKMGADYLAYALMDWIIDEYFVVIETLGERIELIEDAVILDPHPMLLEEIFFLKKEMIFFRKSIWPLREIIKKIRSSETQFITDSTQIYFNDLNDHVIHAMDLIESFRDMLSSILDVYHSSISHKMNEVMRFLTIIGTIFIPLTFVAGLYGMNFNYMPELKWKWGYFYVLSLMTVIGVFLLAYFKRKKWF